MRSALRLCVVLVAVFLDACAGPPQPACTLRRPAAELAIPRARFFIIPVTLGRTTVPFILDTGAAVSILSTEAGQAMGFKRTTEWQFVGEGAGGQVLGYPTRIGVLRLGNGTLFGALLSVQPLFNVPLSRFPVFGLIGSDIVSNWAIDFDARHARLGLYNEEPCTVLGPPWPGSAATAELIENETRYIEVEVTLNSRALDAVLDTGATTSLIGASAARRLRLDLSHDRTITGTGVGGLHYAGHEHRIDSVVVGGVGIGPMMFDVSTRNLAGTDLLLGQDFLHNHRVFVSYRQNRLWFGPASNHDRDDVSARQ